MLSDTTTGPRRRPGAEYRFSFDFTGESDQSVKAWDTDINGQRVHIIVGTNTARWVVLNSDMSAMLGAGSLPYLSALNINQIQATTVGSDFYMLNTAQKPVAQPVSAAAISPARRGFYFVRSGAYAKSFVVTITTNLGAITLSHTTVDGTAPGDAAKATPEFVANALATSQTPAALAAIGVTLAVVDSFVYVQGTTAVTTTSVVSGSGALYITCSNTSKVRLESDLPQILHSTADGYIMTVGEQRSFKYYQYSSATTEWLESGTYNSPSGITNMPVRFKVDGAGLWSVEQLTYEGRVSGDDDNNPLPEFLQRGITGLSSYMNRLVLLSGSQVFMSSSTNPLRFMRSTVAALIDTDPIAVGSSANSSAEYRYAIQFQKDLLLFSDKYQALVPSNGQAITPRTATVVVTSNYAGDMGAEPVPIGRTLLFPAPRSQDFFGFMEMISSQYSEAQYVSNDATAHLPKYMGGNCRFGVSSTTGNMVVFGSTGERNALIVYEYLWDGEQKVQQAWHTWRFAYPVAYAYFSQGVVNLLFVRNGLLVCASVDPKRGSISRDNTRRPFIDLYTEVEVLESVGQVPAWMARFDPTMERVLTIAIGDLAGEELGIKSFNQSTQTFTTKAGFGSGTVCIGVRYKMAFSPTQPVYFDQNGNKVESAKFTILKFGVTTQNSHEYKVLVTDNYSEDTEVQSQATLFYSSTELSPGKSTAAGDSRATIPCRTDADSTILLLYTTGTGEMNITGIDYVGRLNRKIRRR
jgi:hypothetical protein